MTAQWQQTWRQCFPPSKYARHCQQLGCWTWALRAWNIAPRQRNCVLWQLLIAAVRFYELSQLCHHLRNISGLQADVQAKLTGATLMMTRAAEHQAAELQRLMDIQRSAQRQNSMDQRATQGALSKVRKR